MIERRTIMRRWADATRHLRWDEANELWRELMAEWLRTSTQRLNMHGENMAVNRAIMEQWATATRRQQWGEADRLWAMLMQQWLEPPVVDQPYWCSLVSRRMAALERKDQRSAIDDVEWDHKHEDMTR